MKFSVEHWGIMAENPEKLASWYRNVLGFEHLFVPEGKKFPVFIKDDNGLIIEFFPMNPEIIKPADQVRKMQHLSLSVSDFEEAVNYLKENGVEFREQTNQSVHGCQGALLSGS